MPSLSYWMTVLVCKDQEAYLLAAWRVLGLSLMLEVALRLQHQCLAWRRLSFVLCAYPEAALIAQVMTAFGPKSVVLAQAADIHRQTAEQQAARAALQSMGLQVCSQIMPALSCLSMCIG